MVQFRSLLARLLKFLYLTPLEDAFIRLDDLSPAMRILGILGYLAILFMLVLMAASVLWGSGWPVAAFTFMGVPLQVPLLVQIAGLAGLFISWTYILTGVSGSHPLIFLPLLLFFGVEMVILAVSGNLFLAWLCTFLPLLLGVSAVHLFTYKKGFWQKYPLVLFFFWILLFFFAGILYWLGRDAKAGLGTSVMDVFNLFYLFLLPFSLLFGLSIVDLAVNLAHWIVDFLRRLFPPAGIQALAAFLLIARLAVIPLMVALAPNVERVMQQPNVGLKDILLPAALLLDTLLSFPLILAALVLAFTRRWDGYRAAQLLALCLAAPIFALGLMLGLSGQGDISNTIELTLTNVGVLPSMIVFVAMLTYTVLGLGTKFARTDGRRMPRRGRVLLVLGVGLLVASLATYRINLLEVATHLPAGHFVDVFGDSFAVGVVALGLPYLLWIIWKRPERLAGKREEFESVPARLRFPPRLTPRTWLLSGILGGSLLCIFACLLATASFYF